MENSKKVIIIGAGIAGLAAGNYLQMNGYDSEIFENNDQQRTSRPEGFLYDRTVGGTGRRASIRSHDRS